MANSTKTKRPVNLACSRAINFSEGKFSQDNWGKYGAGAPLEVYHKAVLATKSYDMKEEEIETTALEPNPQQGDACALSTEYDTLKLDFSMMILPVAGQIHLCPSEEYYKLLLNMYRYVHEHNLYYKLAQLYVNNIANARYLWRNRRSASQIEVIVVMGDKRFTFNAKDFSLDEFVLDNDDINEIANEMARVLGSSEEDFLELRVTCYAKLGTGMEVFPSQEMTMKEEDEKIGKVLFEYEGSAGMHSQKINNAIRTIDIWYPRYNELQFPLPADNYGANRTLGIILRPKGYTFYDYIDKYIENLAEAPEEDLLYIMAVIVRGGLFGPPSEKKKK